MRREGYEFQVSPPRVLYKEIDGATCEPIERVVIDVPSDYMGAVMEKLGARKGEFVEMTPIGSRMKIELPHPVARTVRLSQRISDRHKGRGHHGTPSLKNTSRTRAISPRRNTGSLIAFETGEAVTYGLYNAQERGALFIDAGRQRCMQA